MKKYRHPKTGQIYTTPFTQEVHDDALARGYVEMVEVFNPQKKEKYTIEVDRLRDAKSQGYVTADELEAIGKESKKPHYGGLEAAAYGGIQGVTFDFGDEIYGGLGAIKDKYIDGEEGSFSDHYKRNRDEARAEFDRAREDNTSAYYAGDIGAGLLVPGGAAKNIGKIGFKKLMARGAGQGALAATGASEADNAGDLALDTLTGGAMGAALPVVLTGAGKAAKGGANLVKKLAPGTSQSLPIVNKAASKLAALSSRIKGEGDSEADFLRLYSESGQGLPSRAEKSTQLESLADEMFATGKNLKEQLAKEHKTNYRKWLEAAEDSIVDRRSFTTVTDEIGEIKNIALSDTFREQFDPSFKGLLHRLESIADNSVRLEKNISEMLPSHRHKETLLHLRQEVDAFYKKLEAKGGTPATRDKTLGLRNTIDEAIKNTSGGEYRRNIDSAHSLWKQEIEPIFKKVVNRDSGKVDYQKVSTMFRESAVSTLDLKRKLESLQSFAKSNPEAFMTSQYQSFVNAVERFTTLMEDKQFLNRIGYSGGPSSPSVNMLTHLGLGYFTGGFSMVLTPIIDPVRWVQIIGMARKFTNHPWVVKQIETIGTLGSMSAESINRAMIKDRVRKKEQKTFQIKREFQRRKEKQKKEFAGEWV